jgi:CRISPR system Cascade subunit CasB
MTTAESPTRNRIEKATRFLEAIGKHIDKDNGAKADFKRALSGEPQHIRKVYSYLLPYIGRLSDSDWEQKRQEEQIWIPVACLSIFYPQPFRTDAKVLNFGHSCLGLKKETNSNGTERRFQALLDLSLANVKSPLIALVRQMKAKKTKILIEYPQLIVDLSQWDHPDQYIQDSWARAFWGAPPSAFDASETSKEAAE